MSSDDSAHVPDTSGRRDAVREKAQQVRARQARARILRRSGIGLVAVAGISAIAYFVTMAVMPTVSRPSMQPANMSSDGVLVEEIGDVSMLTGAVSADEGADEQPAEEDPAAGSEEDPAAEGEQPAPESEEPAEAETSSEDKAGPVEVRVYVDYLSAAARDFELANAAQLAEWVDEDAATVTYHPVALLTAKSNGTKYSQRAAAASACVVTHAPDSFVAYNHSLLTKQPAVDSDGLTNPQLADLAIAVGADNTKVVRSCIENEDFLGWAKEATERALERPLPDTDGVTLTGAPTILVNGKPYTGALDDPAEFAQFVLTASSEAYYSSPTPSATPAG